MTERCADLDEFFDGELPADQADRFRDHLATCERCQRVLDGRMQESIVVRAPAARGESAMIALTTAPDAAAQAVAPGLGVPASAVPAAARAMARGEPARRWGCRRALVYAAPLLAAAAAVPLWLIHDEDPSIKLSLAVEHSPAAERSRSAAPRRGVAAQPGDVLRPKVHGGRYQALWVYLEERRLIAICPGDARCSEDGRDLVLELRPTARGEYAIIALAASEPLPGPGATLDQTLVIARRAGIHTQLQYVDVE